MNSRIKKFKQPCTQCVKFKKLVISKAPQSESGKAFDHVDQEYLLEQLRRCGLGDMLGKYVAICYKKHTYEAPGQRVHHAVDRSVMFSEIRLPEFGGAP